MVQKSGVHQLRLVVYPIVYKVLYIPGGDLMISEPSNVSMFEWMDGNGDFQAFLLWWVGLSSNSQLVEKKHGCFTYQQRPDIDETIVHYWGV